MKKIIAILALILCVLTAFSSCSTTLVPHANGFYNEKEDVYYTYASMCYEAVGFKSESYIKDDVGFEYHIVVGGNGVEADPEHFLYDKTNKTLIYNSETALPTLAELNPTEMHFTVDGSVSQTLTSENDAEKISAVLDICLNAPVCKYPALATDEYYRLKFYSSAHPYILYCLSYVEYDYDYCEYETVTDLENYTYREGVPYTVITEEDGSYTVEYNYGKYFVYNRDNGECRMAKFIHDNYNS